MRLARILMIAAAAMSAAACASYPRETQYSIYADNPPRPLDEAPSKRIHNRRDVRHAQHHAHRRAGD